jgi:hypothetical protein
MTRGKMVLITPLFKVLSSIEFNGDMYYDGGYGEEICSIFKLISSEEGFKQMVAGFNNNNFEYNDDPLVYAIDFDTLRVFDTNYYDIWSSDYLYIKNCCPFDIVVRDSNGKEIRLERDKISVLNFGKLERVV